MDDGRIQVTGSLCFSKRMFQYVLFICDQEETFPWRRYKLFRDLHEQTKINTSGLDQRKIIRNHSESFESFGASFYGGQSRRSILQPFVICWIMNREYVIIRSPCL